MRIDVRSTEGGFDDQTRAYAEFRIFAAMARFSRDIEEATVTLAQPSGVGRAIRCAVSITLPGGARLHVNARGRHAYDAINRAVDRIGALLRDENQLALSS